MLIRIVVFARSRIVIVIVVAARVFMRHTFLFNLPTQIGRFPHSALAHAMKARHDYRNCHESRKKFSGQ